MRRALPLFALSLAAAAPTAIAAPRQTAEQALLDLERQRFDAQVTRDVKALDDAIAGDAIYIHANGAIQTKAEYLKDVEAGTSRYRSIESSDRTAHIYGATAITHGTIVLNVGTDRRIEGRYTGVYAKRGGRWLVLSWQTTPAAPRQ